MINNLTKILYITIIMLILDSLFIYSNKHIFINQVLIVQKSPIKINFTSTLLCYAFMVFGLYYFIIKDNKSVADAILLGITIYSIFELTNKSLFSEWNYKTVLLDSIWGGLLFGTSTYILQHIYKSQNMLDIHPASIR
jgi:hypothetical protein